MSTPPPAPPAPAARPVATPVTLGGERGPSPLLARWRAAAGTTVGGVHDDREKVSYAVLDERARSIAATLLGGRDSLAEERVALLAAPGADFVAAFFGVLLAGGCVVVLSPLHPERESLYFCDDAHVGRVLVTQDQRERAEALAAGAKLDVLAIDDARQATPARVDALPHVTGRAPALQLYTSGTTGKPKGAVIGHDNLGVQQELLRAAWGFRAEDVLLHTLPLHHMHGLAIALLTAIGAGATTRMLPGFDATRVWDSLPEATVFMAVPTVYGRLFAALDAADEATRARWTRGAAGLRLATSGSAALPVTLAERWRALTGAPPVERFGMTEIGVGTTNPLDGARKPGHVGLPLPTVETRIVGEGGVDAPQGELWIRGPSVFLGYFEREEANRAAFVDDPAGGSPWFRTGDTVTRDADGYFKILGRTSVDILKSGGYKLSALEIEEALREHPAVQEVAVVGVPDPEWGDRVVACVVARSGRAEECTEDALRAFAKTLLAPYKVPKNVVRFEDLPRNAVGKVVKPELVKLLVARTGST